MQDYKVIAKRKYVHNQNSKLILVKEYSIIEKDDRRYLILKLFNNTSQTLTRFDFIVVQKSLEGDYIATNEYKKNSVECNAMTSFVPEVSLEISKDCEDVFVELKNAVFETFLYENGKKYTISAIGGKKIETNDNVVSKKFVSKLPLTAVIVFLLLAVLILTSTYYGVEYYKKDKSVFNIDDFTFAYSTDKKDVDSPICVQQYTGKDANVKIPAKIKDHKIEYIGEEAFKDNNYVESISLESDIIIKEAAFKNCLNLKTVNFDKVRFIADEAFMSSGIKDFTTTNTMHIGTNAFFDCKSLKTINIDNKEETVEIFDKAFYLCSELNNLILQNKYKIGENVFKGCNKLKKIDVKEYSYLSTKNTNLQDVFCINELDNTLSRSLEEVHINHMDKIPESFVENFSELKKLKVNVIGELVIPDYAFKGCNQLVDLSLPLGIKKIGLSSFEDCGMKTFNTSNLEEIGAKAFKNCVNLMEINLTNKVTMLKDDTFSGCESITTINIPKKIVSLPNDIFSNCKSLTEIKISPQSNIVSIGKNAFKGCSSLEMFEIPKTVAILGDSIFESCTNLQKVIMPDVYNEIPTAMFKNCEQLLNFTDILNNRVSVINDEAFMGCKQLKTLDLPENISSINRKVFNNCENLQEVNFANNKCVEIQEGAFGGCKLLNNIVLPQNLKTIGSSAFMGCGFTDICFKDEISIGDNAYQDCENLKSFIIECEESKIGYEVLKNCSNIETLSLPYILNKIIGQNSTIHALFNLNNRESIPNTLKNVTIKNQQCFTSNCFANCKGVEQLVLPNAVEFGDHAFANCTNLVHFDFVKTINSIGSECFENCKQLEEVNISDNVYLDSYIFKGCDGIVSLSIPDTSSVLWLFDGRTIPKNLQSITVNTFNVTNMLFNNCVNVKTINLPIAEVVDERAFDGCISLEKINFGEGLKTIQNYAFYNCKSLQTLVIPSTVNSIGYDIFYGCNNLYEIVNKSSMFAGADEYIISEVKNEEDRLDVFIEDNCTFAIKDGKYYLVSYPIDLVEPVVLPAISSNYIIKKSLFRNMQLNQDLIIPRNVEEIGEYAFQYCGLTNLEFEKNAKIKSIKKNAFESNNFENLVLNSGLETISVNAFIYCRNIKSVTLPSTLNLIGDCAFWGCDNLYEVFNHSKLNIKPGTDDNGCIAKQAIEINSPVNFVSIQGCTFACTNNECMLIEFNRYTDNKSCLQNGVLSLPKIITSNGKEYQNYSIKTNVFRYLFEINEIIIPSIVKSIGEYAFSELYNLRKVTFEENSKLLYLKKGCFQDDSNLLEINIPNTVKEINNYAFSNNTNLRRIKIPNTIEKIGDCAFSNCKSLKEVLNLSNLPITAGNDDYGMVGQNAMFINKTESPYITYYDDEIYSVWSVKGECEIRDINFNKANCDEFKLPEIFVLEGKEYDNYTIKDGVFDDYGLRINKLFIPRALKSLNKRTFKFNENGVLRANIQEIIFSEDSPITIIEEDAFSEMSELKIVKLPLNVREIGRRAFYNCTKLNTHIELDKLYKINDEAFANCSSLQSFALPKTIKVIQNDVFAGCNQLVYVENKSDFILKKGLETYGKIAMNAVYISGNYDKEPVINRFNISDRNIFEVIGINDIAFIKSVAGHGKLLEIPANISSLDTKYTTIQLLSNSLYKCGEFTEIYIPNDVTVIEQDVLPMNSKLNKVFYQGTKEEWVKVVVEDDIIKNIEPQYNSIIENGSIVEQNNKEGSPEKEQQTAKKNIKLINNSKVSYVQIGKTNDYVIDGKFYDRYIFAR